MNKTLLSILAASSITTVACSDSDTVKGKELIDGVKLSAKITAVNNNEFVAEFLQKSSHGELSEFEKLDAESTNFLFRNGCNFRAIFEQSDQRYFIRQSDIACKNYRYKIQGFVVDENRMQGMSVVDVDKAITLNIVQSVLLASEE